MEIKEIISDVARAKNDLASLLDAGIPSPRLERCKSVVKDLETGVAELLGTAWIPQDVPQLTASIACVRENMRRLQSEIDDALDGDLFDRAEPDELFRVSMAMTFGRLLENQLEVLIDALALAAPKAELLN